MRRIIIGLVLCVCWPGLLQASNMGFKIKLSYPLSGGIFWVSLPYRYLPADVGLIGILDAEDLCQDFGGSTHVSLVFKDQQSLLPGAFYMCGVYANGGDPPFALEPGRSYALATSGLVAFDAIVVGAHDNALTFFMAHNDFGNLTWVSLPYHLKLDDASGTPAGQDAEDLCRSIGGVVAILRYVPPSTPQAYACGSAFDVPFPIVPGVGYGLVNAEGMDILWTPPHY